MVIYTPGSFVGTSSKGITVRSKGEILNKKPTHALKHLTVVGQGTVVSSNAIAYCMEHKIPVDFFDNRGKHYATIAAPVMIDSSLWQRQSLLPLDNKIALASRIISGKLRNQRNLVKYYHKYHKDKSGLLETIYPEVIARLDECVARIKDTNQMDAEYRVELLAQEAVGAVSYWEYIRLLVADDGIDFYSRQHQGATDLMNSMLNYGYAILYSRVWNTVLTKRLNPSIGVLHAFRPGKPTFVYDIVELFRSQAVDQVVISLVQKGANLEMENGLLSEPTKRLVIQHVLERLNKYEKYRGENIRFMDIIRRQVRDMADFICDDKKTFKPYIAKW